MTGRSTTAAAGPGRLSFGLFGPAIAWLVHLVAVAMIAEWGCISGIHESEFLGVTAVAWGVVSVTIVTALVAVAGTWVAFHAYRQQRGSDAERSRDERTDLFMSKAGLLAGTLFVLIILVESIPVLYFLAGC